MLASALALAMLIKQEYLRIFVKLIGGTHGKNEVTGLRGYGVTGLRIKIPTVKTPTVCTNNYIDTWTCRYKRTKIDDEGLGFRVSVPRIRPLHYFIYCFSEKEFHDLCEERDN
jgi:hypothetical protein